MSLEEKFQSLDAEAQEAFLQACQEVFSYPNGRLILSVITQLAHPLMSPAGANEFQTALEIGRREPVALLWRRAPDTTQLRREPIPKLTP